MREMERVAGRVPPALLQRALRVFRPVDATAVYAHPRPEIARLTRAGALHRLATGYYAVVPDDRIGLHWQPSLEAAALGIAAADAGTDSVALMGISAARAHGAVPRALGVAVVAGHRHRRSVQLADRDATVMFVRRDVTRLDLQRHSFDLGVGLVTTVEQTLLDLVVRPRLGGVALDESNAAARLLLARADRVTLTDLATAQRRIAALTRFLDGTDA